MRCQIAAKGAASDKCHSSSSNFFHSFSKDTLAEWLRRRPAKPMGSPRVGSNPTGVDFHRVLTQVLNSMGSILFHRVFIQVLISKASNSKVQL